MTTLTALSIENVTNSTAPVTTIRELSFSEIGEISGGKAWLYIPQLTIKGNISGNGHGVKKWNAGISLKWKPL